MRLQVFLGFFARRGCLLLRGAMGSKRKAAGGGAKASGQGGNAKSARLDPAKLAQYPYVPQITAWLLGQSDPSNWLLFRCKPHLLLLGAAILSMLFYVRFRETVMAAGSPDEYLAKKYKKRAPSLQNVKFEVCVAFSHVATSPPFLPISSLG